MISFTIPIKTQSTSNLSEHRMVRYKRTKPQRKIATMATPAWKLEPCVVIRLTRIGVGHMDDDNLRGALKAIRDGIAKKLRIDDGSPLIRWEYEQERCVRGGEGVRVEIAKP